MPSELEKILAKRRSRAEDVFESAAAQSSADACTHPGPAREEFEVPPWLEGAVFVDSGAEATTFTDAAEASGDGLPPWFNVALDSGVIFYDPEGQEVVVPSSKVGAFKAALETVIEFEPEACQGPLSERTRPSDASASAVAVPEASEPSSAAAAPAESAESKRQELKANLQKRYFALLRSGLEPNEAAARAILEVAGQPAKEEERTRAGLGATAAAEHCRSEASSAPRDKSAEIILSQEASTEIIVSA